MKIGVCRGLDDFDAMKAAKNVGLDYFETGFGCLSNFGDEKFRECKEMLESVALPCIASNGLIPGNMKIVGDKIDYGEIEDYLNRGFERAKILGIKTIVLGSGSARSFNEGFSLEKAKEQVAFLLSEYVATKAKKIGCFVVIEPLRFAESSMIHTVADGVEIARMTGCDNVGGLADLYHVYGNNDSVSGIAVFKGELLHSHIAEPITRRYPSCGDNEEIKGIYSSFFKALEIAGCQTCSVEAHTDNFAKDIKDAVSLLKSL